MFHSSACGVGLCTAGSAAGAALREQDIWLRASLQCLLGNITYLGRILVLSGSNYSRKVLSLEDLPITASVSNPMQRYSTRRPFFCLLSIISLYSSSLYSFVYSTRTSYSPIFISRSFALHSLSTSTCSAGRGPPSRGARPRDHAALFTRQGRRTRPSSSAAASLCTRSALRRAPQGRGPPSRGARPRRSRGRTTTLWAAPPRREF